MRNAWSFSRMTLEKNCDGGALFGVDQAFLAGAGVHQEAEGERQVGLAGEVFDLLFLAVFVDLEVALFRDC